MGTYVGNCRAFGERSSRSVAYRYPSHSYPTLSPGDTLALAGCSNLDRGEIKIAHTNIQKTFPFGEQLSYVNLLFSDTLTKGDAEDIKNAFFKFITYDSNAKAVEDWIESKPWLVSLRSDGGHVPVQIASTKCREVIANRLYFLARFDPQTFHEHRSKTSVVIRAVDFSDLSSIQNVVIKFMKYEDQFHREIEKRQGLDPLSSSQ